MRSPAWTALFRPGKRYGQWAILDHFADTNKAIWSQREGHIDPSTDEGYEKCMAAGGRAGAEWRILKQRTADGKMEKAMEGFLPHSNCAVRLRHHRQKADRDHRQRQSRD